ncbi:uncharacterized protein LOC119429047 [Nematolebias whitei]|uniref:uncharacterized protein LOC119429047 n=1 Tax=Nematolebias whitei TaxID=451745 RepID=UPI001898433C|nr:uncharacterized protein LOC119429047 [Nematolebias whitei]
MNAKQPTGELCNKLPGSSQKKAEGFPLHLLLYHKGFTSRLLSGRPAVLLLLLLICWKPVSSLDVPIQGFLGGNITLSCICEEPLPDKVDVYWTDKSNARTVLYIIKSEPKFDSQHEKYKGRVYSSVEDYKKGNFSIIMMRLQQDDADTYECTIPAVYLVKVVTLKVSGQRVESTSAPVSPPGGAASANVLPVALILALSLLLCFRSFRHI